MAQEVGLGEGNMGGREEQKNDARLGSRGPSLLWMMDYIPLLHAVICDPSPSDSDNWINPQLYSLFLEMTNKAFLGEKCIFG